MTQCTVKEILLKAKEKLLNSSSFYCDEHIDLQNRERLALQEAKLLLEFVLSKPLQIFTENEVCAKEQACTFFQLIEKRAAGEPLQYLLGKWAFYNEEYYVGPGVLIPRSDTEILVAQAIEEAQSFSNNSLTMLDLCSGSGCVAISVAQNSIPKAVTVTAVEKSKEAFFYLQKNIEKYNAFVHPILGDLIELVGDFENESFDLITSNPPYVTKEEMNNLSLEVKKEPPESLLAQENGLFFYKFITKYYFSKLKQNGVLLYEIGCSQGESVCEILKENGFIEVQIIKDYSGKDRVVKGRKKANNC